MFYEYVYIYIYIYACIYIYIYIGIHTSEIIMDLQLHLPMDVQWHSLTHVHCSGVCSKG